MAKKDAFFLGISCSHNGSVALIKNRKLVAFIATERLTRKKYDRGITKEAIKYVLNKEGIKLKDVICVAIVNWFSDISPNGTELWDKSKDGFSITKENGIEYSFQDYREFYDKPNQVAQGFYKLNIDNQSINCMIMDHHFSHCASSFYLSPYDKAICLSVDFADNMGSSHSVYYFNDNVDKMYRLIRQGGDFAVGSFYGQICDYLGFYPSLTDAGKVMALAAYGKPSPSIYSNIEWPSNVQMGDLFHGDQYAHLLYRMGVEKFPDKRVFYPQLRGEGGVADKYWLDKNDWNSDLSKNMAANAQTILENSMINMVNKIYVEFENVTKNLCLAGGTVLNCVANGKLLQLTPYKNIFIPPAPGDDGLSIGSALFLSNLLKITKDNEIKVEISKESKILHSVVDCFEGGRSYTNEEIKECLIEHADEVEYQKLETKTINSLVVESICKKEIVAYFKGGSETGPRALGHRSLLACATDEKMKDRLNDVKSREGFRPVAPIVLKEEAEKWFGLDDSPFMLFSVGCHFPDSIPSGVHIDNTSRIQTVNEENGDIYNILQEYFAKTKVPCIINTSFNIKGEPIVESPKDAIQSFLLQNIDMLVMENYVVYKKERK